MKMMLIIAISIYCVLAMSQASSVQARQFTSIILFKLHSPPSGRYYYDPHFTDEETEAERFK